MSLQGPTVNHPNVPADSEQMVLTGMRGTMAFPDPQTPTPGTEVLTDVSVRTAVDERGDRRTYSFGPTKMDALMGAGTKSNLQAIIDDNLATNRDLLDFLVNTIASGGTETIS